MAMVRCYGQHNTKHKYLANGKRLSVQLPTVTVRLSVGTVKTSSLKNHDESRPDPMSYELSLVEVGPPDGEDGVGRELCSPAALPFWVMGRVTSACFEI